jgi:hypothetical protein
MTEAQYLKKLMVRLSEFSTVTVFRNNTGTAYQGARLVRFGLFKGSPDVVGWTTVEIKPEHVGQRVAVFTGVEVKGVRTPVKPEQVRFLEAIAEAGGIAVLDRDGGKIDSADIIQRAVNGEKVWGKTHGL